VIAPVMILSTKSPVKTSAIAASLDPVTITKKSEHEDEIRVVEKPFEQNSNVYSQQIYELPDKITQSHRSNKNSVVDSESINSLDVEPPFVLAQVKETPPVTQVIPLIPLVPLPPLVIPSSSLLLSPRVPDLTIATREVETIEETLNAPTHDLDVSLADLEATVETLKQEYDHSETKNRIKNDAPIDEEKKDSNALLSEPITSTVVTSEQKLENIEIHEELPLEDPVIISSQIPQTPIQDTQIDLPQTSPVQQKSEQVVTSSPLFEIDEDSSFGASPQNRIDNLQIDQSAHPSSSVLSPGAALSSVSLSSPAFVLEDAEDAVQDDEGDEGDYYGNETEEQSDSFDEDEDEDHDDDDNIKIIRKENEPAKKKEDTTSFVVEDEEVEVEEIEYEEDEFGDNRDLEEAEDDLDVDDAF